MLKLELCAQHKEFYKKHSSIKTRYGIKMQFFIYKIFFTATWITPVSCKCRFWDPCERLVFNLMWWHIQQLSRSELSSLLIARYFMNSLYDVYISMVDMIDSHIVYSSSLNRFAWKLKISRVHFHYLQQWKDIR